MQPTDTAVPKTRRIVIFGLEDFADIAYEYFTHDSAYEVVGFTVDRDFLDREETHGLPVIPFDELEAKFAPGDTDVYVAIVYGKLNRIREEICNRVKAKGFRLGSYVSSRAFVWHNATIGEHCFIFEDNTIQPYASIGNNVILWSGNHVGHHSRIGDHCFLTSQVVVSGWSSIGTHCFIGVNSTLANNTHVGDGCWINHGTCISGDVPPKSLVKSVGSEVLPLNEAALFRGLARASRNRGAGG